ncbi:hypothetical protein PR048_015777 [Dryococelus australis]|uniref:Uncharacterized protein n=1 Tax=Dryococelus australis TaxID=614101 RepID=A0ABQ9HHW6_9NEOP|nr:hypothetical protein PR048_015777 [Dryococelus australis]
MTPRRTGFDSPRVPSRIFTSGNRASRCHWWVGLPFPPSLHSSGAPYSPYSTLIGSRDLDAKSRSSLSRGSGDGARTLIGYCIPRKSSHRPCCHLRIRRNERLFPCTFVLLGGPAAFVGGGGTRSLVTGRTVLLGVAGEGRSGSPPPLGRSSAMSPRHHDHTHTLKSPTPTPAPGAANGAGLMMEVVSLATITYSSERTVNSLYTPSPPCMTRREDKHRRGVSLVLSFLSCPPFLPRRANKVASPLPLGRGFPPSFSSPPRGHPLLSPLHETATPHHFRPTLSSLATDPSPIVRSKVPTSENISRRVPGRGGLPRRKISRREGWDTRVDPLPSWVSAVVFYVGCRKGGEGRGGRGLGCFRRRSGGFDSPEAFKRGGGEQTRRRRRRHRPESKCIAAEPRRTPSQLASLMTCGGGIGRRLDRRRGQKSPLFGLHVPEGERGSRREGRICAWGGGGGDTGTSPVDVVASFCDERRAQACGQIRAAAAPPRTHDDERRRLAKPPPPPPAATSRAPMLLMHPGVPMGGVPGVHQVPPPRHGRPRLCDRFPPPPPPPPLLAGRLAPLNVSLCCTASRLPRPSPVRPRTGYNGAVCGQATADMQVVRPRWRAGYSGAALECKGVGKSEITEETRRPAASSGTIPTHENPGAAPPGIEPDSLRWETNSLTNLENTRDSRACAYSSPPSPTTLTPSSTNYSPLWREEDSVARREGTIHYNSRFGRLLTALTVTEVKGRGETGDPRENPPTNGTVLRDSPTCENPVTRPGIQPGSP